MLSGLYAKLIAAAVLLIALAVAVIWFGAHERGIGAAGVQAKWDAANGAQAAAAAKASESARATEQTHATDFAGIEADYLKATNHAYPSLAGALPAAIDAGALQLRNACPKPAAGGGVSEATARSRALDAASTQALADRTSAAIAAVRAGGAADARESQYRAQVTALQALLSAERQ